jgi:hypothetical protein
MGLAFSARNTKIFLFLEVEHLKNSQTCRDPYLGLDLPMRVS